MEAISGNFGNSYQQNLAMLILLLLLIYFGGCSPGINLMTAKYVSIRHVQ